MRRPTLESALGEHKNSKADAVERTQLEKWFIDNEEPNFGMPMRVGASVPVTLVREAYARGGAQEALEVGRACITGVADWMIIAIGQGKATLRGWSHPGPEYPPDRNYPGITYHDKPCAWCKGKRSMPNTCSACAGDGFAPPLLVPVANADADAEQS